MALAVISAIITAIFLSHSAFSNQLLVSSNSPTIENIKLPTNLEDKSAVSKQLLVSSNSPTIEDIELPTNLEDTSAVSKQILVSSNSPTIENIKLPTNLKDKSAVSILTEIERYCPLEDGCFQDLHYGSGAEPPNEDLETGFVKEGHIHFSTLFDGEMNFWSLNRKAYSNSSKTLCSNSLEGMTNLTVSAFAESKLEDAKKFSQVKMFAFEKKDFTFKLGEEVKATVSPGSPQVFQFYKETSGYESYVLTVQSDNKTGQQCIYVGINGPGCPWNDHHRTVKNSKIWSRMLKVGYFPISMGPGAKFENSFIISLISLDDSAGCYTEKNNVTAGQKNVTLKIEKSPESYATPVITSMLSLIAVSIVLFGTWVTFWKHNNVMIDKKYGKTLHDPDKPEEIELGVNSTFEAANGTLLTGVSTISSETNPSIEPSIDEISPENAHKKMLYLKIKERIDESPELFKPKHYHALLRFIPNKEKVTLSDMCRTIREDVWHRRQRSKAYLYILPLVCLFYFIPSSQMVWHDKKRAEQTGSMEECYLNYGCSRPWWIFNDFNHLISNFGYVWYGIIFIILVKLKTHFLPVANRVNTDHLSKVGIPQQHSVFFAMGIAMIFQGIFSFCFHICPSNVSLQFDTTMMYVMMTLCFVKIYQFRHPDTSTNAYHCMYAVAAALILEAFSIYITKGRFLHSTPSTILLYFLFGLFYVFLIFALAVDVYYYGAIKTNIKILGPIIFKQSAMVCDRHSFLYPRRFLYSVIFCCVNLALLFYTIINGAKREKSLSSPLLIIFAFNMALYFGYYMLRKIFEIKQMTQVSNDTTEDTTDGELGEKARRKSRKCLKLGMRLFSFLFFICAFILMLFAGYFYASKRQSRNLTPPESRNKNRPCRFMDFFDEHDMWHFLSATALFVACIGLLTIDDDLLCKKRKNIEVF